MGTPPPPNAPPPSQQNAATVAATFLPDPTSADICGFSLAPVALYGAVVALKCDLTDPTNDETKFGGGKYITGNPDGGTFAV